MDDIRPAMASALDRSASQTPPEPVVPPVQPPASAPQETTAGSVVPPVQPPAQPLAPAPQSPPLMPTPQPMPSVPPPPTSESPVESTAPNSPKKSRSKILLVLLVVLLLFFALAAAGYFYYQNTRVKQEELLNSIDSFESCQAAEGSITQEIYPAICVTVDGREFRQFIAETVEPTQIDTTDSWNEYRNTRYFYSIKYPQDWEINRGKTAGKVHANDQDLEVADYVSFFKPEYSKIQLPGGGVQAVEIIITPNYGRIDPNPIHCNSLTEETCISQLIEPGQDYEVTQFAGQEAIRTTSSSKAEGISSDVSNVFVLRNNQVFAVGMRTNNVPLDRELLDAFDQILSTFEFTDSADETSVPTGWQSVTHVLPEDMEEWSSFKGFTLHYPPSWKAAYEKSEVTSENPNSRAKVTVSTSNSTGSSDFFEVLQSVGDGSRCVFPGDEDFESFDGNGTKFNEYAEVINDSYVWRLTKLHDIDVTNDLESTHQLCQKNMGTQYDSLFISSPVLGYPLIRLTSKQAEDQVIEILKHIQITE